MPFINYKIHFIEHFFAYVCDTNVQKNFLSFFQIKELKILSLTVVFKFGPRERVIALFEVGLTEENLLYSKNKCISEKCLVHKKV